MNQEHFNILKQGVEHWNSWYSLQEKECNRFRADLRGADLSEADLHGIQLRMANLSGANLSGADLSEADLFETDLSEAYLRGAYLINAYLSGTYLHRANMGKTDLAKADLTYAQLFNSDLREANLFEANLRGSYLNGTDLQRANLRFVNFSNAHLQGANFSKAITEGTTFAHVDLRETKGLVDIEHVGPSLIQLYTIQLPYDRSALHFLRGAGVPDEWIGFWRSTMMYPVQYHSLFISYSSKDEIFARRLHADLQNHGVRCWFAPEDMKIGNKIRSHIDEAIHLQDKLLLILSKHALTSSWVEDEVEAALEKERRQRREVLFPIRLDESVMQTSQAWAAKLRRARHLGDFTHWIDQYAYQASFDRLLRDLKQN